MDEKQSVSDELQGLLSQITSLFEIMVNENNGFKNEANKTMSHVETLAKEVKNLRKENEILQKSVNDKKRECETCAELREKLIAQNRRYSNLKKNLNALKRCVNEMPKNVVNSQFSELLNKVLDGFKSDDSQGRLPAHGITSTHRSSTKSNVKNLTEEQASGTLHILPKVHVRAPKQKIDDGQTEEQKRDVIIYKRKVKSEEGEPETNQVCSELKKLNELMNDGFHTPKKVDKSDADFIDSPFFNLLNKKGDGSPVLFSRTQGTSPNQLKRKASELESGPQEKVVEKKLFLQSPNEKTDKSPRKGSMSKFSSNLKYANSVEAEISLGGVRKLKQTQLNLEYYKNKNKEENDVLDDDENISGRNLTCKVNDDKNKFGEDDLILGSPKPPGNSFEEFIKNFRVREQQNDKNNSKSATEIVIDPDETFVNSFCVKESVKKSSEESKSTANTPPKMFSRSPEYNSVPYPYKGSPVRKKSERMKLPGQMCMECHKYYEAIIGETDRGKIQEILNRCSKHRDNHYNVVHTPPGYWKPYLTATLDASMQDDETSSD